MNILSRFFRKLTGNNPFYFSLCLIRRIISHSKKVTNEILVIRLDLIGDCAMFSGSIRSIIETYPGYKVSVVCLNSTKAVFQRIGGIHKIYTYQGKPDVFDIRNVNKLTKSIGSKKFKLLLQPQASRMKSADLIAYYTCAQKKIAIEIKPDNCGPIWKKKSPIFYDIYVPLPTGWVSEFEYYRAFLSGLKVDPRKNIEPFLHYSLTNRFQAKYFVIVPGASFLQRAWNLKKFAKVIDHLYMKTGWIPVILGTPSEVSLGNALTSLCKLTSSLNIHNLCGKTSVSEMIDIIGNAELTICNDSGAAHISSAVGKKCIALTSGGHLDRFLPYPDSFANAPAVIKKNIGCEYCGYNVQEMKKRCHSCFQNSILEGKTFPCLDAIPEKTVIDTLNKLIEER